MSEVTAKRVLLKNKEGDYLLPKIAVATEVTENSDDPPSSSAVFAAIKEVARGDAGKDIGEIFASLDSPPPEGAYFLNGQTITNCRELYPDFWEWLNESAVLKVSNSMYEYYLSVDGFCGAFAIESGNVRLPDYTGAFLQGGWTTNIGSNRMPGLPNIKGTIGTLPTGAGYDTQNTGALYWVENTSTTSNTFGSNGGNRSIYGFDASRSSSIYGRSTTVQPPAILVMWCIQVFNAATGLSTQESAQLASQLQTKAQLDLANVDSNIDYVVESWDDGAGGWYRKYRSGWVEQGGRVETNAVSNTINFWVEFKDTNFAVNVQSSAFESQTGIPIVPGARACLYTTTSFVSRTGQNAQFRSISWEARGYAATE